MRMMGGLWSKINGLALSLFFAVATLGMPGTVASSALWSVRRRGCTGDYRYLTFGLVFASVYSLAMLQRFDGRSRIASRELRDIAA